MKSIVRNLAGAAVLASLLAGCQQTQPVVEAVGERLENTDLGLVVAELPKAFQEVSTAGGSWTFAAPGDGGDGTLVVTASEEVEGSINLVEAVKERQAWFEAAEGGSYFGNRELGGPFGTIYTARGAYGPADAQVEETWAYAIHPGAYRLLSVQYTYPTGESGTRVEQLLEFLGELEAP